MKKVNFDIPFCGFYYSHLDSDIDINLEQTGEYELEKLEQENPGLEFDLSAVNEAVRDSLDIHKTHESYCIAYVAELNALFESEWGIKLGLEFETMISPKEYNFTTDRLFVFAPRKLLKKIHRDFKSAFDKGIKTQFTETLESRHTSRPGFISFYSAIESEWFEKPFNELDHIELSSLFRAFMSQVFDRQALDHYDDIESAVVQNVIESGSYSHVDDNIDGPALENRFKIMIDDLKEEAGEFENGNPYNMEILPRCPATLSLFPL